MDLIEKLKKLNLADPIAVVGMGVSGRSAFRYLNEAGYQVQGFDGKVKGEEVQFLDLDDASIFADYKTLLLSPGVDRRRAAIAGSDAETINDIEIFARLVEKPVAAVTGSNGKSTVVTMLTEVLTAQGLEVRLCGNIGRPVLEALFDSPDLTDIYVLELSSYQLEICPSLCVDVGAVLNVSPDHLDRYDSYQDYVEAKANLAVQSEVCMLNSEDEQCLLMQPRTGETVFYGGKSGNYIQAGEIYINRQPVMQTKALSVHGKHNYSNALVSLLMAQALGQAVNQTALALHKFRGLAHRMTLVGEFSGVFWIDDSKATNIGATAAALDGVDAPVWLIAGGLGKNQNFNELAAVILQANVKEVLLIGVDNQSMMTAFDAVGIAYQICGEMEKAVAQAKKQAQAGDCVLLSPATASFDQFSGFAARGECFANEVRMQCQ